ncbi:hypothetical protein BJ165DRAFT_122401 [Panaeolus papilionaceus]|nr:hypothetical protein BJ165DRAFT_122401 [Panaeolus papilionaceus]
MGPTGAGKSTFIEALAGGSQKLAISSNQLAGFTQRVTAYKLVNVVRHTGRAIYLVDTPEFSNTKISEIEAMEMLRDWLKENCSAGYYRILFLTPITVTRLPGSRQRTIKMLKESLGSETFVVTVATTMWDTLHSERTRSQAEKKLEQLRDQVFKGFFGEETDLKRFLGTRNSALQVMDSAGVYYDQPFNRSTNTSSTHLYCDLHERIEGTLQKKVMIESDMAHYDTQTNKELKVILERDQKENEEILAKFISQLVKFGEPPHEFREAAQALRKNIAVKIVPKGLKMRLIFRRWAREPEIRRGPGFDTQLLDTGLVDEPASSNSRNIVLKASLGHLVDVANAHLPKWLKCEE